MIYEMRREEGAQVADLSSIFWLDTWVVPIAESVGVLSTPDPSVMPAVCYLDSQSPRCVIDESFLHFLETVKVLLSHGRAAIKTYEWAPIREIYERITWTTALE